MENSETCKSEQVELKENGIIRDSEGAIIGRLFKSESENPHLKAAIKKVCREIANDKEYKQGWVANIAMAFKDAVSKRFTNEGIFLCNDDGVYTGDIERVTFHEVANEAAKNFLQILCNDTYKG